MASANQQAYINRDLTNEQPAAFQHLFVRDGFSATCKVARSTTVPWKHTELSWHRMLHIATLEIDTKETVIPCALFG